MSNSSKNIHACISALHAVDFAYNTYASSTPAQQMVSDVIEALKKGGGGDLGRDLAVAIERMRCAPAQRASFQLGD